MFVNAASVIMRLGVATTILTGASLILSGQIDFMLLFLFLLVITRVYAPFDQSLALIAEMFVSQVSADRINEIYETPIAKGAETFRPQGHDIIFDHVDIAYDKKQVLRDVSFTAKREKSQLWWGHPAPAKAPCARLAARLWDITAGRITVGGVDISTVDPEVLLTDYSMVFQDVVLFDDTVMENIRLASAALRTRRYAPLPRPPTAMNLWSGSPQGYDTPIGENGAKLSGGERQRISIARALLKGRTHRPAGRGNRFPGRGKRGQRYRGPFPVCFRARRCWSSPTGCVPWREPTTSWCWMTAMWPSRAPRRS